VLLGLGQPGLLDAVAPSPVLSVDDLRVLGARDEAEHADVGHLAASLGVHVTTPEGIRSAPYAAGSAALHGLSRSDHGFWLHLNVDVLDETVFPATDYLMPGGLDLDELAALLRPLGRSDRLIGASVGCYNPEKDPDGRCGAALVDLLADVLGDGR
jgi:arginase